MSDAAEAIAVIGMGCRFPGASSPDAFWKNLRNGVESITFFTAEELKEVEGFWTVTRRVTKNVQSGHWSEAVLADVRYNLKLSPDLFSERALRSPPVELVR